MLDVFARVWQGVRLANRGLMRFQGARCRSLVMDM